jgi:hypothetical protein
LPPRPSLAAVQRWILGSLKAGAAALGFSILVVSESPPAILALLGASVVVLGGTAWAGIRGSVVVRLLLPLAAVVAARVAAGPAAAAIVAILLVLGALLRVGVAEAIVGLSIFGVAAALVGGASPRLALSYWALGLAMISLRDVVGRLRHRHRHGLSGLREERPSSPS